MNQTPPVSPNIEANFSDNDHLRWLRDEGIDGFKQSRVLDLGCGSGYLCDFIRRYPGSEVVGVDILPDLLGKAEGWRFIQQDLDDYSSWPEKFGRDFDFVLAFDILEHVRSPYDFLRACHSIMNQNSKIVLTTPNVFSWERIMQPQTWSGSQDPQHKVLFCRYSLGFLLQKAGFKVEVLKAPVRKFKFLGPLQPHIGGQILCVATPQSQAT